MFINGKSGIYLYSLVLVNIKPFFFFIVFICSLIGRALVCGTKDRGSNPFKWVYIRIYIFFLFHNFYDFYYYYSFFNIKFVNIS